MTARSRALLVAILGCVLVAWVILWSRLGAIDAWWRWQPPADRSSSGQIWSAVALFSSPVVVYSLAGLAVLWAARRRLFAASASIILTCVLTLSATQVIKEIVARPRADSPGPS